MKYSNTKIAVLSILAVSSGLAAVPALAENCAGTYERVGFNPDWPDGGYMRVDPNGEFLILSGNNTAIVQIKDNANPNAPGLPKRIRTQMNAEAYPVDGPDGNWKFVASPNHGPEMRYYDFKEMLARPRDTSLAPAFADPEFNQIYQSTATMNSSPNSMTVRTALHSPPKIRDYQVTLGADGKVTAVNKGAIKPLCANFGNQNFTRPIISRDGKEIAAATFDPATQKETTKIFKIKDDGSCDMVEDLGFNTSKVNWSYPEPGKKGMLTFTASSVTAGGNTPAGMQGEKVYIYDRDTRQKTPISTEGWVQYGGFTKDNKVIYQSDKDGVKGVTIADTKKIRAGCASNEGNGAAPARNNQ